MGAFVSCPGVQCVCQQAITAGPMSREGSDGYPPPPPRRSLSAQISATTKLGCRPWAGSLLGTKKQGSIPFATPPPPLTEAGPNG